MALLYDNPSPQEVDNERQFTIPSSILVQPPTPAPPNSDFFMFRITSDEILEYMEHKLRGEEFDEKTKGWVQKFKPWCSDEFINVVLSTIADYANRNTYLGNFDTDEINHKCNSIKKKIAKLLFKNYVKYKIEKAKRSLLVDKIINTIHSSLSRCEHGMEARQLSSATQRSEVYHEEKDSKGKSAVSDLINRFLRRK